MMMMVWIWRALCVPMALILAAFAADIKREPPAAVHAVEEHAPLPPPFLKLPVFVHSRAPLVSKQYFSVSPARGRSPVPEPVRRVLVPAQSRRRRAWGAVRVSCTPRELRVRVQTGERRVPARLGTCHPSRTTERFVLFQYRLTRCGTTRQLVNQTVVYSNTLWYPSDQDGELVPVPVHCRFNRFYYSYKIGFVPQVEMQRFYKPIRTKGSRTASLNACDEQWNRLSPTDGYVIGMPMYFRAKVPSVSDDERLFLHSCHVTANSSSYAVPQVTVIDNYGCMTDSQNSSQSRFIKSVQRNIVRFSIEAFTLREMTNEPLYMHCEMSVGRQDATSLSKSCTFNQRTQRWEELHGFDSVCTCCDSSCLSDEPGKLDHYIASDLWSVVGPQVREHTDMTLKSKPRTIVPESKHIVFTSESQDEEIPQEEQLDLQVSESENHQEMTTENAQTATTQKHHRVVISPGGEEMVNGLTEAVGEMTPEIITGPRDHLERHRMFEDVFGLSRKRRTKTIRLTS